MYVKRQRGLVIAVLGLVLSGASAWAGTGPIGTYYITDYVNGQGGSTLDAIQGTTFVQNVSASPGAEGPIAVFSDAGDVRTTSFVSSYDGGQYTGAPGLNVTPDGTTFTNNFIGGDSAYDGTTDGKVNYTIDYNYGAVIVTDTQWGGPGSILFNLNQIGNAGITYDATNNSLWIQNFFTGRITDYSMTGTVLSSFATDTLGYAATALAMDVDHTLWFATYGAGLLRHYSTTGVDLGTVDFSSSGLGYALGGEIAALPVATSVPEPSTLAAGAIAALGSIMFARHRRRVS